MSIAMYYDKKIPRRVRMYTCHALDEAKYISGNHVVAWF
jgi:hypothetical protein